MDWRPRQDCHRSEKPNKFLSNLAIVANGAQKPFPEIVQPSPPDPLELVHRFNGWSRVPVEAWQQFDKRLKRWRRAQR